MRRFVESLKRLYKSGRITEERVQQLLDNEEITQDEYNYILEVTE